LRNFRSLLDAYEAATESAFRFLPLLECAEEHARPYSRKMVSQLNLAALLNEKVQNRIQAIAEFHGDLNEFSRLARVESKFFRKKVRTLAAIEQYLSNELHRSD
jgi:hypothetical protein